MQSVALTILVLALLGAALSRWLTVIEERFGARDVATRQR